MSVCHTINMTSLSICQTHDTSVHHAMKTNSLSICQPHDTSIRHTNITTSPSVCLSRQSSDHHTTSRTSPSVCQSRDSSVCYPTRDVIICTVWLTVCSSSVTSILPSANPTVKMPMSIPVRNFPHDQTQENSLSSLHQRNCLSIIQTVCLSTRHHLLQTRRKFPVIMGRTSR